MINNNRLVLQMIKQHFAISLLKNFYFLYYLRNEVKFFKAINYYIKNKIIHIFNKLQLRF